jgi:hypothetical protein
LARLVDLLVFQPVNNFEINIVVDLVTPDAIGSFKLVEPAADKPRRVIVVWVEKAREHSRGRASLPRIIDERPKLNKKQPRISR